MKKKSSKFVYVALNYVYLQRTGKPRYVLSDSPTAFRVSRAEYIRVNANGEFIDTWACSSEAE